MSDDPQNPVALTSVPNEIEAAGIVAALKEQGIEVVATGSFTAGFRAEAPGVVQVLVRQEDLARAQQLLDQIKENQDPIDWSNVDVGKPEEFDS